ncbi:hypothetical protein L1887_22187 [Cichorium endivia]|nr:hypothetical protein L1887_22187 [Cichorium endivia]
MVVHPGSKGVICSCQRVIGTFQSIFHLDCRWCIVASAQSTPNLGVQKDYLRKKREIGIGFKSFVLQERNGVLVNS